MKTNIKKLISSLLCMASLSAVLCGCGQSNSNVENPTSKVEDTTVSKTSTANENETFLEDGSKYNIDLTAEYNEEENTVDTILTNNTENIPVFQEHEHLFYKQNGNKWDNITFSYGALSTWSTEAALPIDGENTLDISISAYPTTNDNGNDIDKASKTKYFTPGEYKVAVKVSVCDPLEYMEYDNNGKTETIPRYDKNRVSFMKEAYFTVE